MNKERLVTGTTTSKTYKYLSVRLIFRKANQILMAAVNLSSNGFKLTTNNPWLTDIPKGKPNLDGGCKSFEQWLQAYY